VNKFARLDPKGRIFPVVDGKDDPAEFPGSLLDPAQTFQRGHQRFFTKNVKSRRARFEDQISMKTRRGADIDKVESLLSEQGVYLRIDPRFRKKLSGQLRLFGIGLHDSNYSEMIVLSP
jgi:hypothetical protein